MAGGLNLHLERVLPARRADVFGACTVVTLSFRELGESTELTLEQGPFATEGRYELHHAGWSDGLERLADALS